MDSQWMIAKSTEEPASLGVVTTVRHWADGDGTVWAYEPYVREMRLWADLFAEVHVCAPYGEGPMTGHQAAYQRPNIQWSPVHYHMQVSPGAALRRLRQMPGLGLHVWKMIRRTDLVLLRSPGHAALLGQLLVRLLGKPSITKWAGLFGYFPGERLPSRVERWLVNLPTRKHHILMYGPASRRHLISFIPALLDKQELAAARQMALARDWNPPWRIFSVGRLSEVKGFDLAIRGLGQLGRDRPDLDWEYTLVGSGPAEQSLRDLVAAEGIADRVRMLPAAPFAEVQVHYGNAHLVIMPGVKEAWPKIVTESWAHGVHPVAASAGIVPWIMSGEHSGTCFSPNPRDLATALGRLLDRPDELRRSTEELCDLAQDLSLEAFKERLQGILRERYDLR